MTYAYGHILKWWRKRLRTSSAKAKGRRLQDWMKGRLIYYLGMEETTDLVRTAVMGERGADVALIGSLKERFPFSIECKNQEKYKGVYDILTQASTHSKMEPLGVIKMNNRKPIIVLDAEYFLEVYFGNTNNRTDN
jgi:hypothetical protein